MRIASLRMALVALTLVALVSARAQDPLPSWNDGPAKKSIIDFVSRVTNQAAADGSWVPPAERIAVFDNDGTLCCE